VKNLPCLLLVLLILGLVGAYLGLDLGSYLSLEGIKTQQAATEAWGANDPLLAVGTVLLIYIAVTALSVPGTAIMTLAEANKYVAGNWKRAHAPERLLPWVERFHAWRGQGPKEDARREPRVAMGEAQ
jgi:hypothetical protein